MLKRLIGGSLLLAATFAKAGDCDRSYAALSDSRTFQSVYLASGVATFAELARASRAGRELARCPSLSTRALDSIVQAAAQKASFTDDARAGVVLAVYANPGGPGELSRLKNFLRLRPWERGFWFSSQLATDALLSQLHAAERNAKYHAYAPDEMDAALKKYVR
jgi:hypothetical protein